MYEFCQNFSRKNGWTQETLAELTGLSTRTIYRVEKGVVIH